ncbi:zinc-binding alcohol dehydrogenase family protein [Enhygromyxa salina]|uniref:Zinc-type alcohol dehydrogenase-like protein n=1 Tax=Enhygromyxa salina TaxID=215803 RepID=A0A2S9YVJ6_9BACT|nr:zinc-binding alcohol dehydrogenase family protein [Enhygromyxa salina]PRQ09100.1 Zinc-type alcohol dehydrogenase-like protein [Enhygromyxa salina]
MQAVAYKQSLPIDHPESLVDLELPDPAPGARQLLVRVEAVSVNPVDVKIRAGVEPDGPRVLGWDAVGVVEAMGDEARGFSIGDRVWYAGALNEAGCNAELQTVDARLVALAPTSLSPAEAAALPLTSITAWELLFERFRLQLGKAPSRYVLLVSGAAGGVGSILVQLAARLTSATVIATAGRPESVTWLEALGAHHVIDYREPLGPQIEALGVGAVTHVASLTHTDVYFPQFVELLAPFGQLALIDEPRKLDVMQMKLRSLSLHWEMMFTRSMYETDMAAQGRLLAEVASLVDAGVLRTTLQQELGPIDATHLKRAHALIESGGSRGKIVLAGFDR